MHREALVGIEVLLITHKKLKELEVMEAMELLEQYSYKVFQAVEET